MDSMVSDKTVEGTKRARIVAWLGPGFLLALVVVFIIAPWSFKGKLDAVCYGI